MRIRLLFVLLFILIMNQAFSATPQSNKNTSDRKLYFKFGFGISRYEDISGWKGGQPSFGMSINRIEGKSIIKIRYLYTRYSLREIGGLYGYCLGGDHINMKLSGGLSLAASETITRFGFPLEIELDFAPLRRLGLGISGYGNINSDKSFYGILFSIKLGKLR